jgi:hypothetical protein
MSTMRIAPLVVAVLLAVPAHGASECGLAHPFDVLEGWNEIAGWTLPDAGGHEYAASYACQGSNRKIVVLQLVERNASGVPSWRWVSDLNLKPQKGEDLIEGAECMRNGEDDALLVPFGMITKDGVVRILHAWRIELPSGKIRPVKTASVKCEASAEPD